MTPPHTLPPLLVLLVVVACAPRRDGAAESGAAVDARGTSAPRVQLTVRRWTVAVRLEVSRIGSFARLPAEQRARLRRLQSRAARALTYRVDALADRVRVQLPAEHPGGALALLLCDADDSLTVLSRSGKGFAALERTRFGDVLDGGRASRRSGLTVRLPGDDAVPAPGAEQERSAPLLSPAPGVLAQQLRVRLALDHHPDPEQPSRWPVRVQLDLLVREAPRRLPPPPMPLLHLALPMLQGGRPAQSLESITWAADGAPLLAWRRTVHNDARPAEVAPTFVATVRDHGHVHVPRAAMQRRPPGYREQPTLPESGDAGRQLLAGDALRGLRGGSPGQLKVRNRSGSAALIYLDGALLGWVGAGRELGFDGVPAGFYRLYAVSPTGVRAWGPRDMYVPGPLTLR